jgi:CRISPR/Cas system-associated exonuclease Cas4 (RecB family)
VPYLNPLGGGALRTYRGPGGALVPSVTEVLSVVEDKVWMNAWLAKAGRREVNRVTGEAAVLGTKVHQVAAALARDRNARVRDPEMRPYARAIGEFMDLHVKRVIAAEMSLCSERLGFGGTLDLYAELNDGSMAVVDYKTNAGGITRNHKLQTAAYAMLLREHGHEVNKRIVVRLHKADDRVGEWYARAALDHERDVETFKACVTVWRYLHGAKLKKGAAA